MISTVGDRDAVVGKGNLARVTQDARAADRAPVGREVQRLVVEQPSLTRGRERALDERRDGFDRELAGVRSSDVPAWIDGNECRPRVDGIRSPDAELPIVQDGMGRTESERGLTNALGDALGDVLAAMDADDGDMIGVLLFEPPQLRKYVDAVDSAVRPEIEEEQLTAEVGEREAPSPGVDPIERCWEVGCADSRAVDFRHRMSEICASEYGIRSGANRRPAAASQPDRCECNQITRADYWWPPCELVNESLGSAS
jgi:hypothetical protein